MINIYKTDEAARMKKIQGIETNSWIDLVKPTTEEIEKVALETKIPESLIIKMLDTEELPRIETEDTATLIVVDVPFVKDKKDRNQYTTIPLGIIINKSYIVTISLSETEVLSDIKNGKIKALFTSKKTRFIIQLLHKVSTLYVKYLNVLNQEIEKRENVLISSTSNKELLNLMNIQKSLVYFITSLKANDILLEKLSKGSIINLYAEDFDLLEDAIIESKQGIETAHIYKEIISSVSDTYATIISNNLNGIMKLLAGITIVSTIPTMIFSFMGMNVTFGSFSNEGYAFVEIFVVAIVLSIVIAIILKKRNML